MRVTLLFNGDSRENRRTAGEGQYSSYQTNLWCPHFDRLTFLATTLRLLREELPLSQAVATKENVLEGLVVRKGSASPDAQLERYVVSNIPPFRASTSDWAAAQLIPGSAAKTSGSA